MIARHPLARYLPESVRVAMATARYERDVWGRRRTRGYADPLGVAMDALGIVNVLPAGWQVAEALVGRDPDLDCGLGTPAGYDPIRWAADDFSRLWECGMIRADDLPFVLDLDRSDLLRAVRWRAEGMGL